MLLNRWINEAEFGAYRFESLGSILMRFVRIQPNFLFRKIKESLAANESPVKCNDPIGDKSFLQLYLQNRKELEALEAGRYISLREYQSGLDSERQTAARFSAMKDHTILNMPTYFAIPPSSCDKGTIKSIFNNFVILD